MASLESPAFQIAWAKIVARASIDEAYRNRVKQDPVAVFSEQGFTADNPNALVDYVKEHLQSTVDAINQMTASQTSSQGRSGTVACFPCLPCSSPCATQATATQATIAPPMLGQACLAGRATQMEADFNCWGSAATVGSAGSFCGTAGSVGTAGTFGCAGNEVGTTTSMGAARISPEAVAFSCNASIGTVGSLGSWCGTAGTTGTFGSAGVAGATSTPLATSSTPSVSCRGTIATFAPAGSVGDGRTPNLNSGATLGSFATFCGTMASASSQRPSPSTQTPFTPPVGGCGSLPCWGTSGA